MGSCICKQPNGLYCRYSSIVETMTDINMTFEDYVKVLINRNGYQDWRAREEAKDIFDNYLHNYKEIVQHITLLNETKNSRSKLIKKMEEPNGVYEVN